MMTTAPTQHTTAPGPRAPQRLLAWTFRRGTQFLTCELLATANQQYAVIVTPHWSAGTTIIEELSAGVKAFQRHAAIVMQLRQQGWSVVAYAPVPSPRTPAPQVYPLAA